MIVNPAAAGGRVGRRWPRLHARLRAAGFDVPFTLTRFPGHATELAAEAVARGAGAVVAAGGDGTICEVVQGLQDAGGAALGILPLGTGNDAARTLGVPLVLEPAAQAILSGSPRAIDLIRVNRSRVVVNAIGVGLLGAININAQSLKHMRGLTAYLLAALGTLARYRCPTVRLASDDGFSYEGTLTILAVQSGQTTGGGFRLTPAALPDDGTLDATLLPGTTVAVRPARLIAALRGRLHTSPGARALRFTSLELSTDVSLPCHLDGNAFPIDPPGCVFEVAQGAQTVIGPP